MRLIPLLWRKSSTAPLAGEVVTEETKLIDTEVSAHLKQNYNTVSAVEIDPEDASSLFSNSEVEGESEGLFPDGVQSGVQAAQATTAVWTKSHLIAAYVFIFIIYFADSLQQQMAFAFDPFVTSAFQLHSLTATTRIVASIIGGLTKLPLAKVLDIWGRPQGFALMACILTTGLIMMALTNDVQTYCAAQVFYWVGQNGIAYSLSIFVADTSSLKNRSLMFAFTSSPYLITTWIGGPAATIFLDGPGWRWGFAFFAVLTPIICSPLLALFAYNYEKAKRAGLIPLESKSWGQDRLTLGQSLKHYAIEFDILGITLIAGGLALFLLPFSLHSYQPTGWRSPLIQGMLVTGILLILGFVLWEKSFAPKTFIPWDLLKDRNVLGANILAAVLFISFFIWDSYFYSFLLVVNDLSVTHANYVNNIYSIGTCLWAIVTGVIIRKIGRYKPLALYFALPLTLIGVVSMIFARQSHTHIIYLIACQVLIAVAGGTLVICEQLAAMAATTQQYIAVVLAVEGMFSSVGGAIGLSISAGIWTTNFRSKLAEYLPADVARNNLQAIYGDINKQLSYPVGSPVRNAISAAYGDTQKIMLIVSTAILLLSFPAVMMWRDHNVKNSRQVRGNVV